MADSDFARSRFWKAFIIRNVITLRLVIEEKDFDDARLTKKRITMMPSNHTGFSKNRSRTKGTVRARGASGNSGGHCKPSASIRTDIGTKTARFRKRNMPTPQGTLLPHESESRVIQKARPQRAAVVDRKAPGEPRPRRVSCASNSQVEPPSAMINAVSAGVVVFKKACSPTIGSAMVSKAHATVVAVK